MKKLYLLLLPVIFCSCIGYKITRIYQPAKKENLITGLELRLDSGYIEQSRGAERLKLDFITINKNTNSVLYSFYYYNPFNYKSNNWFSDFVAVYKESSLMDVSYFEKTYEQFIINNDTLLFNKGLNGIYKYLNLTGIKLGEFSTNNNRYIIDNIVTLVPKNEYTNSFTAATNNDFPYNTYYNGTPNLTIQDLDSGTSTKISMFGQGDLRKEFKKYRINSPTYSGINAKNRLIDPTYDAKKQIGTELTTLHSGKNIVLLHEYKKKFVPEVSDAYSLINDYIFNEIVDSTISNQTNPKGYIKIRLIKNTDKSKVGVFFAVTSGLLLFTPNLIGYPFISAEYKVGLEATIYNNNNQKIKTYTSKGVGKAYMALYWGYNLRNTGRTTQSKAVYSALSEFKKQITKDKDEIENLLNKDINQ